ncbi:hypothetical protein [Sphingobium sp. Sx8-8]|uniref:hypothetical protein n=1 Tax=Sphingobium sp. Sx8-8 TaxID=2933617 RepID=UPI001F5935D1|nr:hypothetical protein [Sphingobium sp. Sx8-8]
MSAPPTVRRKAGRMVTIAVDKHGMMAASGRNRTEVKRTTMRQPHPMIIALDYWKLGMEAATVINLRLPKLWAGNPAAVTEAQRMVSEKIEAAAILQWKAMTGALGTNPLSILQASTAHYRKAVGKNRRRLSRPR